MKEPFTHGILNDYKSDTQTAPTDAAGLGGRATPRRFQKPLERSICQRVRLSNEATRLAAMLFQELHIGGRNVFSRGLSFAFFQARLNHRLVASSHA